MHLPDGLLSPRITLPALAVAAPLWAVAGRRLLREQAEGLPVVGALTALALVVQSILIPLPGGTSTHVLGVLVLAVLRGPLLAFLCESLVLAIQALVLGAGGVTVVAVNALALGLLGPLAGWLAWRALRRLSERVALAVGGWLCMQVASLAVAGTLALQHALDPAYFPVQPGVTLVAMMVPSLTVAGLLEGAYTALVVGLVRRARLDALPG